MHRKRWVARLEDTNKEGKERVYEKQENSRNLLRSAVTLNHRKTERQK